MENINYDRKFKNIVSNLAYKPSLLLHACCGPCSSYVLEEVRKYFNVTVLFYNPNIYPYEEYLKRKETLISLINKIGDESIKYKDIDYLEEEYKNTVIGLESEKEGGKRCNACIGLRLEKTAVLGKADSFEYFGTTLTVSPHKNSKVINELGEKLEISYNIKYLYSDFKKNNGFLKSIENSKKYELYRQNYCGCKYSIWKEK